MSTQPRSSSSAVAPTLEAATTALKIAREATDAVPIAKQILGAAANVFELAEKIEKKRQAMFDLVLAAGEYAKQIDMAVAGRVVDAKMQRSLDRLYIIFTKIEALVRKETAPKIAAMRTLRRVFILPTKAESLATELEREMKLFQLSSSIDTRLAIADTARIVEEDSLYDGDWRRLRHGDVERLQVIRKYAVDDGVLTYASARVDNVLMIVRYLDRPLGGGHAVSHCCPPLPVARKSSWTSYPELLRRLSTVHTSHPNIAQLYGIREGSPDATFAAFRSGTQTIHDFVMKLRASAPEACSDLDPFALLTTTLCYKILDAAWYLKYYHKLVWIGYFATIDESGEPQIGAFDDIVDEALLDTGASVDSILSVLEWIREPESSRSHRTEQVEKVYDGRLFQSLAKSQLPHAQHLSRLWKLLRKERLDVELDSSRFTSSPINAHLSESAILHAREHLTSIWEGHNLSWHLFDAALYSALLQKPLLEPVQKAWISRSPYGTVVIIRHTTQNEDHISFEEISIDVPMESVLHTEIEELFEIDATFEGYVNLDEVECYEGHTDCGFPVDCSGPRFVDEYDSEDSEDSEDSGCTI